MVKDINIEYRFVEIPVEEVIEREKRLKMLLSRAVMRHLNKNET